MVANPLRESHHELHGILLDRSDPWCSSSGAKMMTQANEGCYQAFDEAIGSRVVAYRITRPTPVCDRHDPVIGSSSTPTLADVLLWASQTTR